MSELNADMVEAELTKINFILENLFAMVTVSHGATLQQFDGIAAEGMRQFCEMPGQTNTGAPAPANDEIVSDLAAERLATFFRRVRHRLEQAQGR